MPMEIFVSCVGDLATLGGSVGHDLGPATPWFFFSFLLFAYEALGNGKFHFGGSLAF